MTPCREFYPNGNLREVVTLAALRRKAARLGLDWLNIDSDSNNTPRLTARYADGGYHQSAWADADVLQDWTRRLSYRTGAEIRINMLVDLSIAPRYTALESGITGDTWGGFIANYTNLLLPYGEDGLQLRRWPNARSSRNVFYLVTASRVIPVYDRSRAVTLYNALAAQPIMSVHESA